MSRTYWVVGMTIALGEPFKLQQCCKTAEDALKLGREWWEAGDMLRGLAVWVHWPDLGWTCYREMLPSGRWKNPHRKWVSRSPLAFCHCGAVATHGRGTLCGSCVPAPPKGASEVAHNCAAWAVHHTENVGRSRPAIVLSCPECGPLPHGPSCHQGERQ